MEDSEKIISRDDKIEIVLNEIAKIFQLEIRNYCAATWEIRYNSRAESILIEEILTTEGLVRIIDTTSFNCRITPKGQMAVESGGWKKYLTKKMESEAHEEKLTHLNVTLAESNIEANLNHKRDSKFNRWGLIFNLIFGIVNIIILIISLLTKK
jgi:hypothetical protein